MQFSDLYEFAQSINPKAGDGAMVRVKSLTERVIAYHKEVGQVQLWPVDIEPDILLGYIRFDRDRSSAYGEAFTLANIRFAKNLNRCYRRFVVCKELMHVFDSPEERTDSLVKFNTLMSELESDPLQGMSPPALSELMAQWKALTVLCPKPRQEQFKADLSSKKITNYDVALALRIPEALVPALVGQHYDTALKIVLGK